MPGTIVWLKDDLRLEDNAAISLAMTKGLKAVAFIDETGPGHWQHTPRRADFINAALAQMAKTFRANGITCHRLQGEAPAELLGLAHSLECTTLIANQQVSDAAGFMRDKAVKKAFAGDGRQFIETPNDGTQRGSQRKPEPFLDHLPGMVRSGADLSEAITDLNRFLDRLPYSHYRRDMWLAGPSRKATSLLSMHFASGTISVDRALREISLRIGSDRPVDLQAQKAYEQFAARLHWRRGFIQMFEQNVAAFPWGPMREPRPRDDEHLEAWSTGKTGIPIIDAAMRELNETGWINFRLRQTVCSFAIDLLDLDFHKVGVELGRRFNDYEPGIHWCQIARQSGMIKKNGPRIVNPVKQSRELDENETYIRAWCPELASIPQGFGHDPWRHPNAQRMKPIINPVIAARDARNRYDGGRHKPQNAEPKLL